MVMDEIKDDMLEVNGENLLPEEEQLLGQFFAEHQLEVEDRGFTNRVMRRLPDRSVCLNRIWTAICSVAVAVLFFLTKGWVSILGEQFALDFAKNYLHYGKERDIADLLVHIDAITASQIQDVAQQLFAPDHLHLLMI